jgi:type I restriction enzyme S subunit
MSGRKTITLGAISSKIGSGATPTGGSNAYKLSGVPLIRSQNVLDFSFSADGIAYLDDNQAHELRSVTVEENDVLLNITGDSVARCCIVPRAFVPARVNQHVAIIRLNQDKANYLFVFYVLQLMKDELLMQSEIGATRKALTKGMLENLEIVIPPLPEQKAIAAVLSSLDDKIDLLHRQNQTLEAMAAALFRQWFVEEAQVDWEKVPVGNFVELNRSSIDKTYSHKTIQYLDTGSLTDGKIDCLQSFELSEAPSRAKRLVQHNDILISTVRPDQRHYGVIKNPADNLVVSTGFCVLTCTKIEPHFIYLLLTSDEMTDYLHKIAEGSTSTYPSLKPSDIGVIVFQLPPQARLKEFGNIANNAWEKIEKNHIQIRTLEKLRDTLLPKLMSGEVRVAA